MGFLEHLKSYQRGFPRSPVPSEAHAPSRAPSYLGYGKALRKPFQQAGIDPSDHKVPDDALNRYQAMDPEMTNATARIPRNIDGDKQWPPHPRLHVKHPHLRRRSSTRKEKDRYRKPLPRAAKGARPPTPPKAYPLPPRLDPNDDPFVEPHGLGKLLPERLQDDLGPLPVPEMKDFEGARSGWNREPAPGANTSRSKPDMNKPTPPLPSPPRYSVYDPLGGGRKQGHVDECLRKLQTKERPDKHGEQEGPRKHNRKPRVQPRMKKARTGGEARDYYDPSFKDRVQQRIEPHLHKQPVENEVAYPLAFDKPEKETEAQLHNRKAPNKVLRKPVMNMTDISGLREQIIANAVALFPDISRARSARPPDNFNIIIVTTDLEQQQSEQQSTSYIAKLLHFSSTDPSQQLARSKTTSTIQAALEHLLYLTAAALTQFRWKTAMQSEAPRAQLWNPDDGADGGVVMSLVFGKEQGQVKGERKERAVKAEGKRGLPLRDGYAPGGGVERVVDYDRY